MSAGTQATRRRKDTTIIRFTRQIFYADQTVYQAEVRESRVLRGGPFRTDIEVQLERLRRHFARRINLEHGYKEAPDELDPEQEAFSRDLVGLGTQLYGLLPDGLRDGLPELFQQAFDRGLGVRLIFEAEAGDLADQLLTLPWEILYIPTLKTHLGLIAQVTIVRRLLETVRKAPALISPPFHVAHIIADTAVPEPISPELQAAESAAISGAVGPGAHYTLVANPGSVERIQGLLGSSPYQIVHFLGHGAVDTTFLQQSYLLFEGEAGQPQLVTCEQLPRVIGAASKTQLVVLNACHGASVEIANNVAMQLVYHGIPYVVAMQGEIAQQAAIIFARTFYTALQARSSLEDAVTLGRMQMAGLPDSPDWCLPALFVSQGTVEKAGPARVVHTVEIWLSQPVGQRQLGNGSIALGVAQLVVATLLLLSGAAPPLPAPDMLVLVVGLLAPLPPLMAIAAYRAGGLALPVRSGPSRSVRAALLLRSFTSAALGMGLVAFYSWLTLQLAVAMGFWALLSPIAEGLLLVMLFAPCVLVSWQQALSHAAGLVSNHAIEAQKPGWGELAVVIAGYLMLCGPPLLLWLMPEVVTPPLGNLLAAILLIALGYQVRRQSS